MSTWNIYVLGSGGGWEVPDTIPRANANLDIGETSTQAEVSLADGSTALLIPEVAFKYQPINFTWLEDDGTVKEKIKGYIESNAFLKIVTHLGTEEYYGYFSNVQTSWLVGVVDTFDLVATFRRVEGE